MGKFDGKVVIVTGASSGIGKSTAIAFAKEGANLTVTGRNQERLSVTAKACRDAGAKVLDLICDLNDFKMLEPIIAKTVEKFGVIDILINNAGIGNTEYISQLELDNYEQIMRSNVRAPIFLCKYALPHLRKTKGCIVNVSSCLSMTCYPGCAIYCMTKAALDHFTRGLASECAGDGVRVNCINPGIVETRFLQNLLPRDIPAEVADQIADESRNELGKEQPLGIMQGDEIADGIIYLCEANRATGTTLLVDGGFLLK